MKLTDSDNFKVGNTQVNKIYLGSTEVWTPSSDKSIIGWQCSARVQEKIDATTPSGTCEIETNTGTVVLGESNFPITDIFYVIEPTSSYISTLTLTLDTSTALNVNGYEIHTNYTDHLGEVFPVSIAVPNTIGTTVITQDATSSLYLYVTLTSASTITCEAEHVYPEINQRFNWYITHFGEPYSKEPGLGISNAGGIHFNEYSVECLPFP